MRRNMMKGVGGGGGYPVGTILAYELNEEGGGIATDSINGYEATLGATMSLGGGLLSRTAADSTTNDAETNDSTSYLNINSPVTLECKFVFAPTETYRFQNLFRVKSAVGSSFNCFGSSVSGYNGINFIAANGVGARFGTATDYTSGEHHLIIVFDGPNWLPNQFTVYLDGVVLTSAVSGGWGNQPNLNTLGRCWDGSPPDVDYLRIRNYAVSASEAAQMYADR